MTQHADEVHGKRVSDQKIRNVSTEVLDRLPDFCTIISVPVYRYEFLNQTAVQVISDFGWSDPSSALNAHPWDIFPRWEDEFKPFFEKACSTGESQTVTRKGYNGPLGMRFFDILLIPILDENGVVEFVTEISTDVTECILSEELDRSLNEINTAVSSILGFDEIMRVMVDAGAKALKAETGRVVVRERNGRIAEYSFDPKGMLTGFSLLSEQACLFSTSRSAVIVQDTGTDHRISPGLVKKCGLRSIAVFPLIAKGEVTGYLSFHHHAASIPFTDAQVSFGTKLAASMSLALDNAGLFRELHDQLEYSRRVKVDLVRYRLFFENARDIMFLADRSGVLIDVNDAAVRAYGCSRDEMVGRNMAQFRAPEVRDSFSLLKAEALERGTLYESVAMRKDGTKFPVEVSLKIAELGGREAVLGVVRDISERKAVEEALKISELNYRTIFDSVNEAIIVLDSDDGRVLGSNKAIEVLYGYTQEELSELRLEDVSEGVYPYNQEGAIELVRAAAVSGSQYFEWRAKDKAGRVFWVDVNLKSAVLRGRNVVLAVIRDITERKSTEEALRESEERFRAIFDSSAIGIVIADRERRIIDCNDAYEKMLGYSRSELRTMKFRDYTYSTDAYLDEKLYSELISGKREMYQFEKRYLRKNGEILWGRLNVSLLKSREGMPMLVIGMTEDITERVKAVEALDAERKRLRAILDVLPIGIFIADARGRIVEANKAITGAWGENFPMPEDIAGYDVYKGRWVDDGRAIKATDWALARAIMRGETSVGEMIDVERFDGSTGTILDSAVPMYDDEGRIIGGIAVVQDITALRRLESQAAEYATREAEARATLQTILDTAPVGVVVTQTDGQISYFSKGASDILGGPAEGMVGQVGSSPYKFFSLDHTPIPPSEFPLARSLRDGEILRNQELFMKRPDGVEICILANCSPIRDRFGKVISAVAIFTDVTKMMELRQEVEKNLEQELHFSQMLQQALLPTIPESLCGFLASSIYIPAFASREIGGDFIDLFETESGKIGMLIGDVSGKGLEAASFAAEARSIIHAFAYELSSPAEALTHANAVLSANPEAIGLFVTVFLVIADPCSGEILCCGAGHPPAAICHSDGSIEFLPYGDLPIGVTPDYKFHENARCLCKGEKIVLYTDGITEARRDGSMFGMEGIERVLSECGARCPKEVVGLLVDAAKKWAGDGLRDDTAVMIVLQPK
jgi:PAS domain S-box-containing protein